MDLSKVKNHPAADAFPMMSSADLDELAVDIKTNGQRLPVILVKYRNEWCLLDGRNRKEACRRAGIKPRIDYLESFEGDDEAAYNYAVSVNISRRHLGDSQRAAIAVRLSEMSMQGRSANFSGLTQGAAAKMMNVGESSVRAAKAVLQKASPEVTEAILQGEVTINKAADIVKMEPAKQPAAIEKAKRGEREPRPETNPLQSKLTRISDEELDGLQALYRYAAGSPSATLRAAAETLKRIVPHVDVEVDS